MKRTVGIILVSLFFYAGCGHVENLENKNYELPMVKYQPKVFYPVQAQENSLTGITKVIFYVNSEGNVTITNILESSGYHVLDSTAEEYCRELTFNPASVNGNQIGAWVKWEVKFDVNHENFFAKQFVYNMVNLYSEAASSLPSRRKQVQEKILTKDSEFVKKMTDVLNFNRTIEKVLLPQTLADWKKDGDSYPLSFLLYYDFIQRFPDFAELSTVKQQMLHELKYDISLINNMLSLNSDKQGIRERLLRKLQKFAEGITGNSKQIGAVVAWK
jgi:TonB family protein